MKSYKRILQHIILFLFVCNCATPPALKNVNQKTIVYLQINGLSSSLKKENIFDGVLRLESELTVAAVGDIIPHNNIKLVAKMHKIEYQKEDQNNGGYDYLFDKVRDYLRADITIANYESPLAPETGSQGRPFIFNSDPDLLRAAKKANITVFNIANNHIYDQGLKGFDETLRNFEKEKADLVGLYMSDTPQPILIEKNNIKISIFGFTTLLNNEPQYNKDGRYVRRIDIPRDLEAVKKAKSESDIVMVYIHWGEEYSKEPTISQRTIAEALADAGADIIIGGHPHVLEPLELIPTKDGRVVPVAFSLGNFISNQSRNYYYPISGIDEGRTRDSVIMRFVLKKFSYAGGSFVVITDLNFLPLWTHNNNLFFLRGLEKDLEIYPFVLGERLSELKELINKSVDNKEKVRLIMEYENLLLRLKTIKETIGEDYVR